MTSSLIEIRNLSVTFPSEVGTVQAVRNVSLDIRAGEVLGIVGESGSGKTVTSLATIGLLPDSATVSGRLCGCGGGRRGSRRHADGGRPPHRRHHCRRSGHRT